MYSLGNLKFKFGSQGSGLHLTFRETHQLRISVVCNLTYSITIKIKRVGRGKQGDAPSLVASWTMNLQVRFVDVGSFGPNHTHFSPLTKSPLTVSTPGLFNPWAQVSTTSRK